MKSPRILVVDWLRGLAVVLMILAHAYDAWLDPALRTGARYEWVKLLSGIPSRLFLFLVGVSVAVRLERHLADRGDARALRRQIAGRGLAVVVLAYLFRLQEYALSGFWGGWQQLVRVDILNCIGASMLVLAAVAVPSGPRPRHAATIIAAAVFLGLGPLIGPAVFPDWLPRALTSYLGGQRPMSWFPLFPWGAWALVGVAVGHVWLRAATTPARAARTFLSSGLLGALTTGTVVLIRKIDPHVIRYPSDLVQQMGPGSFFYRLGLIGVLALLGWGVTRLSGARFSPMQQLGRTSLLVYWVHVDLCYGPLTKPWQKGSSWAVTSAWFVGLTLLMLGLSVLKTRYGARVLAGLEERLRPLGLRSNSPATPRP
jgi:uncharacterized membrane protein